MWAETVDPSDLHNTVWPRAAAVAEVLWTPYEVIHPGGAGKSRGSQSWHLSPLLLQPLP
jgi:N-acetyl-beta-hexosaminidase